MVALARGWVTPPGALCDRGYVLCRTVSTIASPQIQRLSLTNVSWLLDTRKNAATKTMSSSILLFAKDYRTMTSGWQGAPYIRRYTAGSWFKNRRFHQRKSGRATVKRLVGGSLFTNGFWIKATVGWYPHFSLPGRRQSRE